MAKKKKRKLAQAKIARVTARRASQRRQYGVIPVRVAARGTRLQVLLLTSRGTGRWVIPKGWPMAKRTPAATARREAYEEAGIKGRLFSRKPVGSYRYVKSDQKALGKIEVQVFLLTVEKQKRDWPECTERRTRWFSVSRAASLVRERELAALLRTVPGLVRKT